MVEHTINPRFLVLKKKQKIPKMLQGDQSKFELLGCESMQDPQGGVPWGYLHPLSNTREFHISSDRLGNGFLGFCFSSAKYTSDSQTRDRRVDMPCAARLRKMLRFNTKQTQRGQVSGGEAGRVETLKCDPMSRKGKKPGKEADGEPDVAQKRQ